MINNKKIIPLGLIDSLYGFLSYGIDTILVLYLIKIVGDSNYSALNSLSVKSCLIYSLPILSSFISNKLMSNEGLGAIGLFLMTVGLTLLNNNNSEKIILSLSFLTVGYSLGRPMISIILGKITSQQDNLKFIRILYLLSNLSLLLAPIVFSLTLYNNSKNIIILLSIISFIINFIYVIFFSKQIFQQKILNFIMAVIVIVGLIFIVHNLLNFPQYLKYIFFLALVTMVGYLIKILHNKSTDDKKYIYQFLTLIIVAVIFFTFFSQQFFFMPLFIEKYINLTIYNFKIPTPWFNMLNPFFGIITAPILNFLFKKIKYQTVVILTLFLLGLSILVFALGIKFMNLIIICIFITYFLFSVSELLLVPYIHSTISLWKRNTEKPVFMGYLYLSVAFSKICAPILALSNTSTSYLKNINNNETLIKTLLYTSCVFIILSLFIYLTRFIQKSK